jgi:tRNA threonylcarbamoyladenosine biosynthesis protein TsaB
MKLLAFDTSTEHLSIAVSWLLDGRVQVRTHEGPGGAMASSTLIPAALALLAQAGLTLRELDAIVFGAGPGSFTGLRTACAVAQGLGYGAGVPLLPVDTLLAVAEEARHALAPAGGAFQVVAVLDARMDEVYARAMSGTGPSGARAAMGRWASPRRCRVESLWTVPAGWWRAMPSRPMASAC